MFKLNQQPLFARKLKKLFKKNKDLSPTVRNTLNRLASNPSDPRLKSHKVIAKDGDKAFSSSVTGDLRIIWRYRPDKTVQVIDLIDIGGHSGSNKVYQ